MMGFIEASDGRAALRQTVDERRQGVIDSFARYYGNKAKDVEQYVEMSWSSEEYSRGCYAGYFPTGVWSDYGDPLRAPVGRVHWAGTETAEVWNGYMEGAIRSGQRAAAEVVTSGVAAVVPTTPGPVVHTTPRGRLAATGADTAVEAVGAAALAAAAAAERTARSRRG